MGWFFTKAALLTFGGAYAVLPYVYQGAVESYQWLTAAQMIDGLALGESTPGTAHHGRGVRRVRRRMDAGARRVGARRGGLARRDGGTFFTFLPSFSSSSPAARSSRARTAGSHSRRR
jgi:chromate transporter